MDHELFFVPIILFVLFVAPLWLVLHYRERARRDQPDVAGPAPAAGAAPAELGAVAARMEKRIAALESVLDAESPGWRQRHAHD
ncbi:MAG TPA: envelope stress response membrane protein PspB [Candidatus Binatia bacterium]|nr:envelope stress response membrane protein PspB [Candidatus Binatia bacterium]